MRSALYHKGLQVRHELNSKEYVESTLNEEDPFKKELDEFITEHILGTIWTRPGLDRRTRCLITVAMLAASPGLSLNEYRPLSIHIKAALKNGCTKNEIYEVLLHSAPYCGLPHCQISYRIARETFEEIENQE